MAKIKPNAYNGWDPLKQVILGNCYTPEFFDSVKDPKLRHSLQKLLIETQEDLQNFKSELEKVGVEVLQIPENSGITDLNGKYENVTELYESQRMDWNTWLASRGGLPKPMIAPRDTLITYGDKLALSGTNGELAKFLVNNDWIERDDLDAHLAIDHYNAWQGWNKDKSGPLGPLAVSRYKFEDMGMDWNNTQIEGTPEHKFRRGASWNYQAPSVTRVGDTLVVDQLETPNLGKYLKNRYPQFKQTHVAMGGHSDGIFCPVKPGHIITTDERVDYSDTFPGWDVHVIRNPSGAADIRKWNTVRRDVNGAWWTPEANNNDEYVKFINTWMKDWVGYIEETCFEVNMLVINPELVFCINYNEGVFKYLESIGVTPHIVPFRHRFFWDSGLHCLTTDTIREGGMQSYF